MGAPEYIEALKGQVASFATDVTVAVGGETILDLLETEQGLVLFYRGQKYLAQPVSDKQT